MFFEASRVSASCTAISASRRWRPPAATFRASPCAIARGTSITLSHFCPTAASQLFREDVALEIVESPPAFPPGDYDGLAVTPDDLPPLLRPDVLMDDEGYAAWERHMVAVCADAPRCRKSALATLTRDAGALRTWRGGVGTLRQAVARIAARPVRGRAARHAGRQPRAARRGHALRARRSASGARRAAGSPTRSRRWSHRSGRASPRRSVNYVAGKAFASWTAYQGRGVATIVRGLEAALALVRVEAARQCRDAAAPLDAALLKEAIRQADFILNHLAVGEELARGVVERRAAVGRRFSAAVRRPGLKPRPTCRTGSAKVAITGPWSLVPNSRCTTHDSARAASAPDAST